MGGGGYMDVINGQCHCMFGLNIFIRLPNSLKNNYRLTILVAKSTLRVQPGQCYFTVQITGINFEYSL